MEWLLLLFLLGKRSAKAPPGQPTTPGQKPQAEDSHPISTDATEVQPYSVERLDALTKRAARGAEWAARFVDGGLPPDVAAMLGRWAGIESDGVAQARSTKNERGLLQTSRESAVIVGGVELWERYGSLDASRESTVKDSIALFEFWLARGNRPEWPGAWKGWDDTVWRAKMYHALPVLMRELAEQGILGNGRAGLRDRWAKYKPSRRIASYGIPTRDSQGLWERFVAAADVVAYGERYGD